MLVKQTPTLLDVSPPPLFFFFFFFFVRSFQRLSGPSASSFHAPRHQAINGVVSLAMCPQVVSQAPQHFGSSETQTTCYSCFSCTLVYRSFISLEAGMARAVHPKEFLKVDVKH